MASYGSIFTKKTPSSYEYNKKKNKKLDEKFQSSIVQFKNHHISKEKVIESTDLGTFPSILTA